MNRQSSDEQERSLDTQRLDHNRNDNEAWALKWDSAALAEMKGKRGDEDRWDRP